MKIRTAGPPTSITKSRTGFNATAGTSSTATTSAGTKVRSSVVRKPISTTANIKGNNIDMVQTKTDIADAGGLGNYSKNALSEKLTSMKNGYEADITKRGLELQDKMYNHATDLINNGKDQLVALVNSLINIPEPVLLETLKTIADQGGVPSYKNNYCIDVMVMKDYVDVLKWFVEKFHISITEGATGKIISNSISRGSVKTSLWYLSNLKASLPTGEWDNIKYDMYKKVLLYCKLNLIDGYSAVTNALEEDEIDITAFNANGNDILGKKYAFNTTDVNIMFPEKKVGLITETYPRSISHVNLFSNLLSKDVRGDNRLIHTVIHKRIKENVVIYNSLMSTPIAIADDVLKTTGLDKIIDLAQHPEQIMYLYIKGLKNKRLL